MKTAPSDSDLRFGDLNLRWGNPSYLLEYGNPGWVNDPNSASYRKPTKTKRNYMASNPTPDPLDELIAAGEDLYDGVVQHGAAVGLGKNTAASSAPTSMRSSTPRPPSSSRQRQARSYSAPRTADSNGKGFIARSINVLSISSRQRVERRLGSPPACRTTPWASPARRTSASPRSAA